MKRLFAVVILSLPAFGQATYSGAGLDAGGAVYGAPAGFYAALPQLWVDNNELTCAMTSSCYAGSPGATLTAPAYELALGSSTWVSATPPSYCGFSLPYAATGDGKQAAITAMEACRTAGITHGTAIGIILDIPPGVYTLASGVGIIIPQTSNTLASAPLILRSTSDSTLTALPEPVGAGGIQDNLASSTNIGLNNPDFTGQNLYFSLGPQNPSGIITGVTTVSVNSTTLAAIAANSAAQLLPLANGYVSPVLAPGSGCVTVDSGNNSECVVPVSGANQDGIYGVFAKTHALGVAATYAPNAGLAGVCNGSGTFRMANGVCKNIAQYNYLQSMYVDECSAINCVPIQMCSGAAGDLTYCGVPLGPDHWMLEDGAAMMPAGNTNGSNLVFTGSPGTETALSQFASHIHFRRYAALGDWTSLATGYNSIASGFDLNGCQYCSVVGSQTSQLLRPGAEGHAGNGDGTTLKFANDWFEGQSSCIFPGGYSSPPGILGFVPFTDVEFRRSRCTYPYSWLGGSISGVQIATDGSLASGSAVLTAGSNPFPPGQTGYNINIKGAGAGGATLTTTVLSYQNPGQVTLSTSASTTVSGAGTISIYANPQWTGSAVRKNCSELKSGERVLMYGFICENVDNSGGQNGISSSQDPRNTSGVVHGASLGQNYQSVVSDLNVIGTIFRNTCEGINDEARGVAISGVTYTATRELFSNILEYATTGSNPGCNNQTPGIQLYNGHQLWNAIVTESAAGIATATAFASVDDGVNLAGVASANGIHTTYTTCLSGCASTDADVNAMLCGSPSGAFIFVSGFTVSANNSTYTGFQCSASSAYVDANTPLTITLVNSGGVSESPAGLATANPILSNTSGAGYQVTDIRTGEPATIQDCGGGIGFKGTGNSAFNVATYTLGNYTVPFTIGPLTTQGSLPWSGVWSALNDTVIYPWPPAGSPSIPVGSTDNSGSCIFSNVESGPSYTTFNHITFVGDALATMGGGPAVSNGPPFIFNHALLNSILLSQAGAPKAGWYNSAVVLPQEGTNTEIFNYDVTSMTADHLVWPGRPASLYTPYGNNPAFPVATPVMYFPATDYCSGSTYASSGSNCVAFAGAMSLPSGPMPLTLPDYHLFSLRSDSPYHNQAPDGGDIGVNILSIDSAQTVNTFVCTSLCGSPGPFPD